jgi:diguanylate cyclase (GGDEF)-like protein/PAS domain S-box-containing protein
MLDDVPALVRRCGADGQAHYFNLSWLQFTGRTATQELGGGWLDGVHSADRERCAAVLQAVFNEQRAYEIEYRLSRHDGAYRVMRECGQPFHDEAGGFAGYVCLGHDITDSRRVREELQQSRAALAEARQIEQALRDSEERYALAARGANDGLWDWNFQTDRIYFSPRWKALLGLEDGAVGDTPEEWLGRVHPDDADSVREQIARHRDGATAHFESEHRIRHADGSYRWVRSRGLAVRDEQGTAQRMAGSQIDVTEHRKTEEQLRHNTLHDALTGLPNRVLFMERLTRALEYAKRREDYLLGVLFLDFDHFKVINDSLGHLAGDQFLTTVARRFQDTLRGGDTVARLGGDEFAILLDDINGLEEATYAARRIQQCLQTPFLLEGHEVFGEASIGIALSTSGTNSPEEILRDADTAMYRAKNLGRGRYEVFDTAMHAQAMRRLQMETELRRAIEREEFVLHYQPIIDLTTGRINGFETLVRWRHPQRGVLAPGEFLPLAEETGLIVPLDHWVLREACRQRRAWQEEIKGTSAATDDAVGNGATGALTDDGVLPTVSVNLSSRHFSQPDMVERVAAVLEETGLEAGALRLEITESALVEKGITKIAATALARLSAMGVRLSMDDFGTGYSSLNSLHRFPVSTLKIDRSYISAMLHKDGSTADGNGNSGIDEHNLEIIRAILALARNLKVDVIAEGVETQDQMAQLRSLDCEFAQGHFFARPVDSEAAGNMLTKKRRW